MGSVNMYNLAAPGPFTFIFIAKTLYNAYYVCRSQCEGLYLTTRHCFCECFGYDSALSISFRRLLLQHALSESTKMLLIYIWTSYYYKHNAATTRIPTHLFFHHFCVELQFESVRLYFSTNAHIKLYVLLRLLLLVLMLLYNRWT
jgi:hypothetical protein